MAVASPNRLVAPTELSPDGQSLRPIRRLLRTRVNDRSLLYGHVSLFRVDPNDCRICPDLPLSRMCPYRGPGPHRRGPLARPGGSLRCPTPRSTPPPPTPPFPR